MLTDCEGTVEDSYQKTIGPLVFCTLLCGHLD